MPHRCQALKDRYSHFFCKIFISSAPRASHAAKPRPLVSLRGSLAPSHPLASAARRVNPARGPSEGGRASRLTSRLFVHSTLEVFRSPVIYRLMRGSTHSARSSPPQKRSENTYLYSFHKSRARCLTSGELSLSAASTKGLASACDAANMPERAAARVTSHWS